MCDYEHYQHAKKVGTLYNWHFINSLALNKVHQGWYATINGCQASYGPLRMSLTQQVISLSSLTWANAICIHCSIIDLQLLVFLIWKILCLARTAHTALLLGVQPPSPEQQCFGLHTLCSRWTYSVKAYMQLCFAYNKLCSLPALKYMDGFTLSYHLCNFIAFRQKLCTFACLNSSN